METDQIIHHLRGAGCPDDKLEATAIYHQRVLLQVHKGNTLPRSLHFLPDGAMIVVLHPEKNPESVSRSRILPMLRSANVTDEGNRVQIPQPLFDQQSSQKPQHKLSQPSNTEGGSE